ncbi:MAG: hypothetical protein R2799_00425 [Crocinitomicaceae bacterium]
MKRPIYIIATTLILSSLVSCGSEETKKETEKTTENKVDSTADSLVSEKKEIVQLEKLEDYASLKTYEEAVEYFGEDNMIADTSWYAEGTVMMLSNRCTDPNNKQIIMLVWEKGGKDKLSHVEAHYNVWDNDFAKVLATQKISSNCGLFTGMKIGELQEFCGQPVKFSGFGWDFAGGVRMLNQPKLEACNINLTLDLDQSDFEKVKHLLGDVELSSDQEEVKGMPIFVQKLTYYVQ